eukprot:2208921-Karenia_brevis.AAC.1
MAKIDPNNATGWRHAKAGAQPASWERPLVQIHGLHWWEAAKQGPTAWRASRKDFVRKICEEWSLGTSFPQDQSMACMGAPSTTLTLPAWTQEDFVWEFGGKSFELRVDNLNVAQLLTGQTAIKGDENKACVHTMLHDLSHLVLDLRWRLRWSHEGWVQWIPRERNFFTDAIANFVLDKTSSIYYRGGDLQLINKELCNYVVASDGAYRRSSNMSSSAWAIFAFLGEGVSLIAAGALLLSSATDSFQAELIAAKLGIKALLNMINGLDVLAPHAYDTTLQFEELPDKIWRCLGL